MAEALILLAIVGTTLLVVLGIVAWGVKHWAPLIPVGVVILFAILLALFFG